MRHPGNFLKSLYFRFYIFIKSFGKKSKQDLINSLGQVKKGLAQESVETKEMLEIYYRYSQKEATKEEMERANEQFRDLLKATGLGFFAVLPFSPITIPLIVKIGKKVGIEILPSSFK